MWAYPLQLVLSVSTMLTAVDGGAAESFGYNAAISDFDDKVSTGSDVLLNTNVPSELLCAHACSKDSLCLGFFYHEGNGDCTTTRYYFNQTSGLQSFTGMKYYRGQLWMDWSPWSGCSIHCGSGTENRARTCHPDSPIPCSGDSVEVRECLTSACIPYARTCAEWEVRGLTKSTTANIDPSYSGTPVAVTCDFDSEPGKVFTILNHFQEARTYVSGYEAYGAYSITLTYSISLALATVVVDLSTGCTQYLAWECHGAHLSGHTFWRNRDGVIASYFTGSPTPGKRCACGDSGTCAGGQFDCNCDENDYVNRIDEGNVTIKSDLPISALGGGDTVESNEWAHHTIGPLLCY